MYIVSEKQNIILEIKKYVHIAKMIFKYIPTEVLFLNHDEKTKTKGHFGIFLKKKHETRKEGKAQRLRAVVAPIKA